MPGIFNSFEVLPDEFTNFIFDFVNNARDYTDDYYQIKYR